MSGESVYKAGAHSGEPVPFSDHVLVTVKIINKNSKGRKIERSAYWKLKESVWEDNNLCIQVQQALEQLAQNKVDAVKWESFKADLKGIVQEHCKRMADERKKREFALRMTLRTLLQEEERTPGLFADDIRRCQKGMEGIMEERYKGAMIRSRELNIAADETPSKVFLALEHKRKARNIITKVQHGRTIMYEQQNIEGAFNDSYTDLFKAKNPPDPIAMGMMISRLPRLKEKAKELVAGSIQETEIKIVIKKLKRNKAPGPDGIGTSFYKKFTEQLSPVLADVFQDIAARKLLPPSMRQAYTVLLPKKSNQEKYRQLVTTGQSAYFQLTIRY